LRSAHRSADVNFVDLVLPAASTGRQAAGATRARDIDTDHREEAMMRYRAVRMIGAMLALALACAIEARAGEPTDQIRAQIDELYRVAGAATPGADAARAAAPILDRMFDWSRMAEAALRGHWQQRTPAERTEFTQLFAAVFRRAYVSRIHLVDASKFEYQDDTIDGDRATVKTTILTKRGSRLDVDYVTRLGEGRRWRIGDVRVEGISLIDNYRTQFDSIIARSSYTGLVERLRSAAK
jgi:phospholipid transport system substrate-binding protein